VIDQLEGRRIAEAILSDGVTITSVHEYPIGWAFYYQATRYLETGVFGDMLVGNAPVLVERVDGSIVPTGTGEPIEIYIERYEHRREWRHASPVLDVVISDVLEAFSTIGPEMLQPVRVRVEADHPAVPPELIDEAVALAIEIGERVLALTEGATIGLSTPRSSCWPTTARVA
jgi:hypothetical protein